MTLDAESRRIRAKQVGRLMQCYRQDREGRGRGGRLSQSGLLGIMGEVRKEYADYSHSTVARWESGEIFPTRERLETFGAALRLHRIEIDGLISLAGLEGNAEEPARERSPAATPDTTDLSRVDAEGDRESNGRGPSYAATLFRYCLTRVALPGLVIAGAGYGLHSLNLSAPLMFALYVVTVVVLVMAQGIMKLRRDNQVRDLLFVSIFFILTAPLFQSPIVGTDVYGFYTIDGLAGTPFIYLGALMANLLLASTAAVVFDLLWRWQYSGSRGSRNAYQRAAWVAFPPVALVYLFNLLFAGLPTSFALLVVLPVVGGVMMALLLLRDSKLTIGEWERRFLLQAGLGVTVALTVLGGLAIVTFYLNPVMISPAKHTTLLYSLTIDFNALGYPESDMIARYLVSSTWSSITTLAYMTIVLGGSLLAAIYRVGKGGPLQPGEAAVPVAASASPRRRKRKPHAEVRYLPGRLSGYRVLLPRRSGAGFLPT